MQSLRKLTCTVSFRRPILICHRAHCHKDYKNYKDCQLSYLCTLKTGNNFLSKTKGSVTLGRIGRTDEKRIEIMASVRQFVGERCIERKIQNGYNGLMSGLNEQGTDFERTTSGYQRTSTDCKNIYPFLVRSTNPSKCD